MKKKSFGKQAHIFILFTLTICIMIACIGKTYGSFQFYILEIIENHPDSAIISRIKGVAISYLVGLIDRGKAQGEFTTEIKTKILVKEILGSFQELMNERQLTYKMICDLKKYQSSND